MPPDQNPTMDNSALNNGTDNGTTPTGEGLTLAKAMGYSIDESKPADKPAPATDTAGKSEGSDKPNAEPQKTPTWFEQLSEEAKGDEKLIKTLSKFTKVEDLAKSYAELQHLMGSRIELPKEDADADAVNAFWQKVGKPKTADEYDIEGGDDAKQFKELAFSSNLTAKQAKDMYATVKAKGLELLNNQRQELNDRYRAVENALKDEYGNQFSTKVAMLDKGIKAWGGDEVAKALIESGAMFNVHVAKMFIRMGESATESGTINKGTAGRRDEYVSRRDGGGLSINI